MLNKTIANIVFYKVPQGSNMVKQATIFYSDGSVRTVSFEQGIDACEVIVKERHIQTKDAFREMINRDVVHVMTAQQLKENFNSFVPDAVMASEDSKVAAAEADKKDDEKEAETEEETTEEEVAEKEEEKEPAKDSTTPNAVASAAVAAGAAAAAKAAETKKDDGLFHFTDEEEFGTNAKAPEHTASSTTNETTTSKPATTETSHEEREEEVDHFSGADDFDAQVEPNTRKEEPEKKKGFFARTWEKIKKNKLVKRLMLCGLAVAMAFGIYSCSKRQTLEGEMNRSNIPAATTTDNTFDQDAQSYFIGNGSAESAVITGDTIQVQDVNATVVNSHFYNNAQIAALLDRTTNETQKGAMSHLGTAMDAFNNNFASYYLEEGVDVRPALKFDEVVAMQVAYNDYSKDQLKAYFNGADIKAEDLSRAYKDGSLQLMGAYAIENSEHPVDMSSLIDSEEGKAFYQRYHTAFLAAKEATGEEKLRLVSEFYRMVHNDFPVSEQERTEGISHSENYENLPAYKLSVAPMIAAGEMMWQNLETDFTLNDSEIDFINDLGLCNRADKSFERAELVALTSETDGKNPTYEEYREAFINYYKGLGTYYVDDEHRELTKLQSFQDAVNWHFDPEGEWTYQGQTWTTTETHTEEHHWTETETTYHEETETHEVAEEDVPEDVREDLQHQVDAEIEAENERRRREAEEAADRERQRLQAEEDAHAQQVEQEVQQDEQDLQQHIDDANTTIDHNHQDTDTTNDTPVNEADLGHGVDFDDDHSDSQGNLDSSVEHITTDPTGDQTGEPLPDPNETGRAFDAAANSHNSAPAQPAPAPAADPAPSTNNDNNNNNNNNNNGNGTVESVPVADDYYYEDSWIEFDEEEAEEGYQYHK